MERDRIKSIIKDIKSDLISGAFDSASEADVCAKIVYRLLHGLSWNVYKTSEVRQEYPIVRKYSADRNRKADFALFGDSGHNPVLIIEVKALGKIDIKGEEQLFDYAYHSGVPIVILTDGREWQFYTPMVAAGDYNDRCFYELNLVQHDIDDCVDVFLDFLLRESVLSDKAFTKAQEFIKSKKTKRKIRNTLPKAWVQVFAEAKDSYLAAELREAVVSICGHTPQESDIKSFLDGEFERISKHPVTSEPKRQFSPKKTDRTNDKSGVMSARSQIGRLHKILCELAEKDGGFLARFEQVVNRRARTRKFISRDLEDLYEDSELFKKHSYLELPGNWYMGKNMNTNEIKRKIKLALKVSNKPASEFGSEFSRWLVG